MADTYKSLADLIQLNDKNVIDSGCTDLFDDAPLMAQLGAGPSSNGTLHKYLKQTGPAGAGFRAVNTGLFNTVSTDTTVSIALQILDASFGVDKAEADAYQFGAEAFIQRELRRKVRAAMFLAETQVIYGTDGTLGNASGFLGLEQTLNAIGTNVINANGSTANGESSIYVIRTNDMDTDVQLVYANGGRLDVGETIVTPLLDSAGKRYTGYYTPIQGWYGLQVGSIASAVRIANVDATHGATDALIYSAIAKFPAGRQPNKIIMNRQSLEQLRKSRSATNVVGALAPRPNDVEGIEIVVTDAISNNEAVVS